MKCKLITIAVVTVIGFTACSSGGSGPSLSEAFCNDLKAGLSPFQIYAGASDDQTIEEFASDAYGMAAISCKTELKSNAGLRSFLESWDINPDA